MVGIASCFAQIVMPYQGMQNKSNSGRQIPDALSHARAPTCYMCILSNQQPKRVVPIAPPLEMSAKGRGGARNGAGRKRQIAEGTPQSNPCAGYDFRQWCEHTGEEPFAFWELIKDHFKKVTWQLEKSPDNGHLHWQGRGVLWKRLRPDSCELTTLAQSMFGHHGWWMQPTSKLEYESGLARYMGKWDTRVAGPWNDMSPPTMKTSDVQFLEQQGLLPWHRQMLDHFEAAPDPREITCVIAFARFCTMRECLKGQACKTFFRAILQTLSSCPR